MDTRPDVMAFAPGNVISHNLIYNMPRNGIFGFRFNGGYVIEHNWIHNVLNESDDGGLVHICASALNATAPAIIRSNLLYNAVGYRYDDDWYGRAGLDGDLIAIGIYLDDSTSHVLIANNVIANTRRGAVYLHDGENNTITNNLFLNDRRAGLFQTRSWIGNKWQRNVFSWETEHPYYGQIPVAKKPDAEQTAGFDDNLIWHGGHAFEVEGQGSWEQWRDRGFDRHSLVADPKFEHVDLPQRVCRLSPDSPAYRLGFREISLSDVGPR